MASPSRRALLAAAPAGLLAACQPKMRTTVSTTPTLDQDGLLSAVETAAADAKGTLGVGLMNLENGENFQFNGERRFPMQSVFKLPLGVAVLSEVDAGRVLLAETVYLLEEQLSPPHSPIAAAWPGRREYTVKDLLEACVVDSDNTAADVLMKRIGGPGALTAWLNGKRLSDIRIDRYERELQPQTYGMPAFRPAWRNPAAFAAARSATPPPARAEALRAYMADPRDTATPRGMLVFLQRLVGEGLVSPASTRLILAMMDRTARGGARLRAGLPGDARLAHRPGTAGEDQGLSAAHNDVGIFTLGDGRAYAIAVFLSGSTLNEAGRDAIIARVARAAVQAAR